MKLAQNVISNLSQADIRQFEQTNHYVLETPDGDFDLTLEDVIITSEDIPGWLVAVDNEITVALDIAITPELKAEGIARELVNRIQNIRKNSDFLVTDRINIKVEPIDMTKEAVALFANYIANEVLADSISLEANEGEEVELLDDINIRIQVEKA